MALFKEGPSIQLTTTVATHKKPIDIEVQDIDDKSDFKDASFPPTLESLLGQRSSRDVESTKAFQQMKSYQWMRMRDLKDKKPELFIGGVSPNDVNQGALANCYFLSSVSALAEYPERVERLFYPKQFSASGKYIVALCITGMWVKVEVDDYLPVNPAEGFALAFAMSKNNELWASLLEKAYAKAYGGYAHIGNVEATVSGALYSLTGAPTFNHLHDGFVKSPDQLVEILRDADLKKFIIVASSSDAKKNDGIESNLSYTFLSIFSIDSNTTLVKMRNPWGKSEWKGGWSDNSKLWTPELRKKVDFTNTADDGVFFMDFRDFLSSFSMTTITHYREDYFLTSCNADLPDDSDLFLQFELTTAGEYYFGVCQASNKHFVAVDYKYGLISFIVCMQNSQGQWEYVASENGEVSNIHDLSVQCKPGKYLALIYANWKSASDDISFNVYGPQKVSISTVLSEANRRVAYEYIGKAIEHKLIVLDQKEFPQPEPDELATMIYALMRANYTAYLIKNIYKSDLKIKLTDLTFDSYIYPTASDKPTKVLPVISIPTGKHITVISRTADIKEQEQVLYVPVFE